MELIAVSQQVVQSHQIEQNNNNRFIEANTQKVSLSHLKKDCVIPVFAKDNETTIAHFEFIETVHTVAQQLFSEGDISLPNIRVSHIIKGRTPCAIGKPAKELLEHEKTIYYERMAFMVEIPHIYTIINNQKLVLTVGGVRSYNEQNLFSKKSIEKFKVFIGFKNNVCTNLCISTDGLKEDLRVGSIQELEEKVREFILLYNQEEHIKSMKQMLNYSLSEKEFAHLVGKMKMYHHLDKQAKKEVFELKTTDSQISSIVKDYYQDDNFKRDEMGTINLWDLYNLFTEASKGNYIDNFLNRNCNAHEFIQMLGNSIKNRKENYFTNHYYIAN